jgi:uncharacterized membrane protein YdjX (TVP38/TMEM64 family)
MILHSFIPFPAEMLAMANGMLYGPLWGTVITWTGAMLGAYLAFGLARWLGRPFVLAMVGERHRVVVDRWAAEQGGPALLFTTRQDSPRFPGGPSRGPRRSGFCRSPA